MGTQVILASLVIVVILDLAFPDILATLVSAAHLVFQDIVDLELAVIQDTVVIRVYQDILEFQDIVDIRDLGFRVTRDTVAIQEVA